MHNLSRAVWLVPTVLLVIAIGDWPYGYYQVLRIIVCGACACLIFFEYQEYKALNLWVALLGLVGVLFNPIFPIHLTKEVWRWLNVISAVILVAHLIYRRELARR